LLVNSKALGSASAVAVSPTLLASAINRIAATMMAAAAYPRAI